MRERETFSGHAQFSRKPLLFQEAFIENKQNFRLAFWKVRFRFSDPRRSPAAHPLQECGRGGPRGGGGPREPGGGRRGKQFDKISGFPNFIVLLRKLKF